ncbi:MAG: GspH/FimT family pseudopilin [Gammaproteobacteria bacterium]|nr:GspH/FimT family pseudopilin [Gammaproteobacteria bacterium]
MLIVIAIAAIFSTLAMPSFSTMIQNSRLTSTHNSLLSALQFTRAEAVTRKQSVTLCRSSSGSSCGGNWEAGWIIFNDLDGDGAVDGGDGDQVLRLQQEVDSGVTVRFSNGANQITFTPRGTTPQSGTLRICDSRGASEATAIIITPSGRARRGSDGDSDGVVDDDSGNSISCP